jgi:c-di-GMP-binding flagellar brake protein YcgR
MIERRAHPRVTAPVPVEVHAENGIAPVHCTTSDISAGGCYIESMYPFPVNTFVDLKLQIIDDILLAVGRVVTCHPQVGNGIEFVRMLPEDREQLSKFVEAALQELPEKT